MDDFSRMIFIWFISLLLMPLVIGILEYRLLRKSMRRRYAVLPLIFGVIANLIMTYAEHNTLCQHIFLGFAMVFIIAGCWFLMSAYALIAVNHLPRVSLTPSCILWSSAAVTVAAFVIGVIQGLLPTVHVREIVSEKIPASADGYTILLTSDLHLRPLYPACILKCVGAAVERYQPNLILDAGDLVDGAHSGEPLPRLTELIREWRAPDGKFTCQGNHDTYAGDERTERWRSAAGLPGLGQRVQKDCFFPQPWLRIIASDQKGPVAPNPYQEAHGQNPYTILLRHHPPSRWKLLEMPVPPGFDLILSGHTHGGQLFPANLLVNVLYGFRASRFHQLTPETKLYICRGTFLWNIPNRFFVPGEIVIFKLRSNASS